MRDLAAHNEWLKDVRLSTVEDVQFRSKDGTDVDITQRDTYGTLTADPSEMRFHSHDFH